MELDKELIARRFGASFEDYDRLADVQKRICVRLAERIDFENSDRIFEIGAGTGFLTRQLAARRPQAEYYINDLSPAAERFVAPIFEREVAARPTFERDVAARPAFLLGDAEAIDFPQNLDLIATASTVQWFAYMPAFAARAARALRPHGVLAMATFGRQNFHELRKASGTGLDYLDRAQLEHIFKKAGFAITHAEEWLETLEFDSPRHVLRYVKALGLNALDTLKLNALDTLGLNALSTPRPSAFSIARAYPRPATLTYHPIILIGVRS